MALLMQTQRVVTQVVHEARLSIMHGPAAGQLLRFSMCHVPQQVFAGRSRLLTVCGAHGRRASERAFAMASFHGAV